MRTLAAGSINQDKLAELRDQGYDSELLLGRLDFNETEGMRKDLAKLLGKDRVFPEILPTQASGRWSTKNPNLGGFKREFWKKHSRIIHPDQNEWWVEWDWSGIEARMFTSYAGDDEDVALFNGNHDIHLFTCSKYLMEWAPDLDTDSPLDGYNLPTDWQGKDDERRVRAKNFRYGVLQYGQGPRAILGMPGIEKLGLNRSELVGRARRFLEARPKGVAWKRTIWESCRVDKVARTFMGRRRFLFGPAEDREKDGLAHVISGSVADLMAWCLIEVIRAYPETSLILNKHDGAILAMPNCYDKEPTMLGLKQIVEREWEFALGVKMVFPADWGIR